MSDYPDDVSEVVERLRQRAIARVSLKRPSKINFADAALDHKAADILTDFQRHTQAEPTEAARQKVEGAVWSAIRSGLSIYSDSLKRAIEAKSCEVHANILDDVSRKMTEHLLSRAAITALRKGGE